jgi:hypothetical protein
MPLVRLSNTLPVNLANITSVSYDLVDETDPSKLNKDTAANPEPCLTITFSGGEQLLRWGNEAEETWQSLSKDAK